MSVAWCGNREPMEHFDIMHLAEIGTTLGGTAYTSIMQELPLAFSSSHLLMTMEGQPWLLDTGSPSSFGDAGAITLDGQEFPVASDYMGLSGKLLSGYLGQSVAGLIGTDILNSIDVVVDIGRGLATFSRDCFDLRGDVLQMEEFMSIPIIEVKIGGQVHRMFFDTGAQISYFQDDSLSSFPARGVLKDFFPGVGEFETQTHDVPAGIGSMGFLLRCGRLPGLFGMTLGLANATGVVGNEVCAGHQLGYFARRGFLVFA